MDGTAKAGTSRVIRADNHSPGGKHVSATPYIDRQHSGPFGSGIWVHRFYMRLPFQKDPPCQTAA